MSLATNEYGQIEKVYTGTVCMGRRARKKSRAYLRTPNQCRSGAVNEKELLQICEDNARKSEHGKRTFGLHPISSSIPSTRRQVLANQLFRLGFSSRGHNGSSSRLSSRSTVREPLAEVLMDCIKLQQVCISKSVPTGSNLADSA